jgi:hypothetical protein
VFCSASVQAQIKYQSSFMNAVEETQDTIARATKVQRESGYNIPQKSILIDEWRQQESSMSNHIIGFYIHQLLWGRFTISYERLFADKTIGIKIPMSLTYDPYTRSQSNSSSGNTKNLDEDQKKGFIIGLDINSYHDLKPSLKYYFGPRIRYGKDILLGGIEGFTFQIQNGLFKSIGKRMITSVGVGFGFFKLSEAYAIRNTFNQQQVYPWASISLRLGFRL